MSSPIHGLNVSINNGWNKKISYEYFPNHIDTLLFRLNQCSNIITIITKKTDAIFLDTSNPITPPLNEK